MLKRTFGRLLVALFVTLSVCSQGTWVLAETIGNPSRTANDATARQQAGGALAPAAGPTVGIKSTADDGGKDPPADVGRSLKT